jgi:hypothetical protein
MAYSVPSARVAQAQTTGVRRFVDRVAIQYGAQSVQDGAVPPAPGAGPGADLVVSFDGPAHRPQWEDYVVALSRTARKVLIVIVRNPEQMFDRMGHPAGETSNIARVLWSVGRVREHAYLGVPSWVQALERARGRSVAEDTLQAPVGLSVRLAAPLHAFVVDTAPRTPQARRRLGLARDL